MESTPNKNTCTELKKQTNITIFTYYYTLLLAYHNSTTTSITGALNTFLKEAIKSCDAITYTWLP